MNSATVIKGMAELLIEEETVPERIDQLFVIISSVDKVAEQLWTSQQNSGK